MGRDEDKVRVHREMREAAAIGEERLARIPVGLVLVDRVLDVLAVERVLELGGEDRDAVQEQHEVEALLVLRAVAELAHHGEAANRLYGDRGVLEGDRIVLHGGAQDILDRLAQAGRIEVGGPQQIDVAGGSCVHAEPFAQEQRSLEHESLAVPRAPQPMQEALHGVQLQQLGEGATRLRRRILQPDLNRMRQAGCRRPRHCSASR